MIKSVRARAPHTTPTIIGALDLWATGPAAPVGAGELPEFEAEGPPESDSVGIVSPFTGSQAYGMGGPEGVYL